MDKNWGGPGCQCGVCREWRQGQLPVVHTQLHSQEMGLPKQLAENQRKIAALAKAQTVRVKPMKPNNVRSVAATWNAMRAPRAAHAAAIDS